MLVVLNILQKKLMWIMLHCQDPMNVKLKLPELLGNSIEDHFYQLGEKMSSKYKNLILNLIKGIPKIPDEWKCQVGWTRYHNGTFEKVDFPSEDAIVFDVEVCCQSGAAPTIATAVSTEAWYGWVSDDLVAGENKLNRHSYSIDNLIPLESSKKTKAFNLSSFVRKEKIAVGHNVSFDRSKVKEQYWIEQSGMRFLDTLSMHVCVSGVTSYQKALLKAGVGDEEWSKAKRVIEINRMLSYWRNSRERVENQFVCWVKKNDIPPRLNIEDDFGAIIPQVVVCGTLTRRAVEPTWMTASNVFHERVGSELRAFVQAPPGFVLVGADVDSQELWIASLLGDAYAVGLHGATPLGWMTLNGQKSDETDMHSVTAKAVGISRNNAKILNYARIYGAGEKFAQRLLKQFNEDITSGQAIEKAEKMMQLTKGKRIFKLKEEVMPYIEERVYSAEDAQEFCKLNGKEIEDLFEKSLWFGGTESSMFNSLEMIASKPSPETPFLNCKLSRALSPQLDHNDKHLPTRINWVVQSGAVDFLHLMLVSMRWFLGPLPRFCLSFHDEVRYLVPAEFKYEAALALHVTNLLTRAFCVSRVGMVDLPLSVAFFSSVEIDTVLRKDSKNDNKTPSNPFGLMKGYGIPLGESLDIYQSIEKANGKIGLINTQ
ncbi:unnamed protein product [Nezara viridula]|uniref:DNA polymerase subunit gamma-1 n=1 Tax=Nezara viridula TaxID=85310 RepID=A0A9P0E7X6_NEZVI|nr:unnamed protein product [Nezara viridula]